MVKRAGPPAGKISRQDHEPTCDPDPPPPLPPCAPSHMQMKIHNPYLNQPDSFSTAYYIIETNILLIQMKDTLFYLGI